MISGIKSNNVYTIKKNENYIGFEKIKNWHLLGNSVYRLTNHSKFEYCIIIYKELLEYILNTRESKVVLFNCTSMILLQEKIGKQFFLDYDINIIIDHGQNTILYSIEKIKNFNNNEVSFEKGFKYVFKKISIKEILQNLKRVNKNIVIISGIKAGRGQSYKTEDDNELHLTDLVYLPPVRQSCEKLIQACGRITGIYSKTHKKLNIWTTKKAKDSILEYINYQKMVLKECKESTNTCMESLLSKIEYSGYFKM
jgi:hypothetical protein